jgi:hypothetical protein
MKYIKIFENAPVIGNSMVQFTSKNEKLDQVRNEINAMLSSMSDKQIGYNYATGSKGIYFTNAAGDLVDESGYGCTTYSELLSNLESILYTIKNINNPMSTTEAPIEVLPVEQPTNDIVPTPQPPQPEIIDTFIHGQSQAQEELSVSSFESFRKSI